MALSLSGNDRVKCPYCFVDLSLKKVAFRCGGVPKAGYPSCVVYPDFVRQQVLNDATPVMPPILERRGPQKQHVIDEYGHPLLRTSAIDKPVPCDRCGSRGAVPICVNCHSVLPDALEGGAVSIGVVGVRNSGKTVFLSLLDQQLLMRMPERFQASIDHPGGSVQLAQDLARFRVSMEQENRLPQQTASERGRKRAPSVYAWRWLTGARKIISVYDTAGEDLANRDTAMSQLHLSAANAIFLVLDPFLLPGNEAKARDRNIDNRLVDEQRETLDAIIAVLRQWEASQGNMRRSNGKIRMPLAILVTKMDAFRGELPAHSPLLDPGVGQGHFDDEESRTVHEHLRAQLDAWGGASVTRRIEAEFENFRYFSISALGNEPDYVNGHLNGPPTPTRVVDPLLWVLSREGFVLTTATAKKGR